ncbi:Lipopolysaccharide export system protein LptA [Pelosinus fermentans]|uniref:LptA/OstA family protein n=1 Tax=Pelosinus fermentans TaxID=365349 RepID=UPI00026852E6|nr:LptA/OstA family protein [Pelosinus fermentans]OAM96321.1 OstA family protein [Pelosinus fermentans DSM 17108]SDR38843.1 Lipopolysaccharide export system protein LptA [Pelosinus fermentans]
MNHKILLSLILLLCLLVSTTTAFAAKPIINADNTYYDVNTGLYMLQGNVYIEVANRIITAGQAKVSLSSLEVWGSDGITLSQDHIYLTAGSVYVYGRQNKAMLDGGVTFKQPNLTITSDTANFNWRTKLGIFNGQVQITQGDNTWSADSVTYNIEANTLQ